MSAAASYDVIVVGLGGMGSAAAYWLANRGVRVLGLEMHQPGHAYGSSHGHHRIIREAYFEAPEYVPYVQRAYQLWEELEDDAGQSGILTITGGLLFGMPDSEVVHGTLTSARLHGLAHEELTPDDVARRFPGFRLSADMIGVYEPRSGFVAPELAIATQCRLATERGAELRYGVEVAGWEGDGDGVRVRTAAGETYSANALVLTTGPWAGELLAGLDLPLTVWRIVNGYFEPLEPERYAVGNCPIYLFDAPEGTFYGFPHLDGVGLKIGRHDNGEPTTARAIRREIDQAEIEELRAALAKYLPGAAGPCLSSVTCMYTMTPDQHFIIDRHPAHPNVVIGCGFSGHGFKFAAAIGETLGELATGQQPSQPVGFLELDRFATLTETNTQQ